jgi:hypothetical protein
MSIIRALGQYFIAVYGSWVSLMSGIGSVVLSILLAFWGDEWTFLKDNKSTFIWLALICLFMTGFTVWYKNRPDILIEQRGVFLDAGGERDEPSDIICCFVTIMLYMVPTTSIPTAIKSYKLIIKDKGKEIVGVNASTHMVTLYGYRQKDLDETKNTLLQQGLPNEGWIRFYFPESCDLKGKQFVLTITDTFNISRKVKGRIPSDRSDEIRRYIPPEAFKV